MTAGAETLDDRIGALQDALRKLAGIKPVADLAALRNPNGRTGEPPLPGARSLAKAMAVIDHHFELVCDLLIIDDRFGTVGVVHFLDGIAHQPAEDPTDWCRRTVENAAYLRHLALTKTQQAGRGPRPLPLAVDLVLVLPRATEVSGIGDALRDIARESNFLHGIGIHLLPWAPGPHSAAGEAALRRAFCWTLPTIRRWFPPPGGHEREARPFRGVELVNWRLPGTRSLNLQEDARVHLVYGANGSGKSSLVEAIEYLATGRIDRLERVEDIARIVEHAPDGKAAPASAKVRFLDAGTEHDTRLGPPVTPVGIPSAGAFRLNQPMMDRLVTLNDADRISYFISTFFPDFTAVAHNYDSAEQVAREARDALPERFRKALPLDSRLLREVLSERLAWRVGPDVSVDDLWTHCFALSRETLRRLVPLAPQLGSMLAMSPSERLTADQVAGWLGEYDRMLGPLSREVDTIVARVDAARRVLALPELAAWKPSSGTSDEATAQTLNGWLRSITAVTIMSRHMDIVRSLDRAKRASERPLDDIVPSALLPMTSDRAPDYLRTAESELRELVRDEESARRRITGLGRRSRWDAAAEAVRPTLTEAQVQALDQISHFLMGTREVAGVRLGHTVSRAIVENRTTPLGGTTIGIDGWTRVLDEQLEELETTLEALRSVPVAERLPGPIWAAFQKASETHDKAKQAADALSRHFLSDILGAPGGSASGDASGPLLTEAIDELMTLMTPARWAYPAIGVERGEDDKGQSALHIRFGDMRNGELRLNTAELNLLTLSLFMLCAPKAGNPLHLLVLDDPLQNMDEMTVTVFSRGLAKIATLLGEPWRLILLLHGEDDFERMRQELPAASYRLPWLSPTMDITRNDQRIMPDEDQIWTQHGRQSFASLQVDPLQPPERPAA